MEEGTTYDKKSLLSFTVDPEKWDWGKIAKHCVAFANARGGEMHFGIEDDCALPPSEQTIPTALIDRLQKGVGHHCVNVAATSYIEKAENGGEVLVLKILPSRQSIAATTDGRYFIRVADESRPVMPDELQRLASEKDAYVWELQTTLRISADNANPGKRGALLQDIRASDRTSLFVREKPDEELLEHFSLTRDGLLTNLGILWIGEQSDRKRLLYYPSIQFIKYDQREQKVAKKTWTDASLNPRELIEAVWNEVPDWKEYTEIPNGLLRDTVPHYDEVVIRELLANAVVHKPYTARGDIYINLHPDRMEIHNPGLLPLGVTPQNILHQSIARNRHLAELFYALGLMEKEGSGYDRVYEVLLSQARHIPIVREENDRVIVTIERRIIKPEVIDFLAHVDQQYQLTQRERISLGLLVQQGSLTALEFTNQLAIEDGERLRSWLGRLPEHEIVTSRGKTRATEYRVNAKLLRQTNFKGPTTLKSIAPHRLRELILTDLATHAPTHSSPASKSDIHKRIGVEISESKLRRALDELRKEQKIDTTGKRGRGGGYFLCQTLPNK